MNLRDRMYIEDRLLAPCTPALEAYGRLQQVNEGELASRVMAAMQVFQDELRAVRRELPSKAHAGSR